MMGNPYSSNEPGLGPLMREVKNKICQDCELVALLEDDSGMELLVNNKIISLDLPVKEVYKKIWLGESGHQEVSRMEGLTKLFSVLENEYNFNVGEECQKKAQTDA
jgi:E3 ubiquitin-protein ligase UBR4